jgi:hypothetical protein
MLGWLVSALLKPLTALGDKYLDNQKDRARLEAGVTEAAYRADASVRGLKLASIFGRLPLFIAETACALYIAAILIDSTWPMDWLTPLQLPGWFMSRFDMILASIFGLATFERIVGRRK